LALLRPTRGLLFLGILGGSLGWAAESRADDPAKEVKVVDRRPLSLCVYYPQKRGRNVSSTDMLKYVSDAAAQTTDLEPVSLTDAEISECAALTTPVKCFVERIDALQRARKANAPQAEGGTEVKDPDRLLLLIAARPTEGDDELVSAALINVTKAVQIIDDSGSRPSDEIESRIIERAILARPDPRKVSSTEDARMFMNQVFEKDFRSALEATGDWMPYGTVDIKSSVGELSITLDDSLQAGLTAPKGITRLKGVRAGTRKLSLGGNDQVKGWDERIEVKANETLLVEPQFAAAPNDFIAGANLGVEIAGGALFAAGTGILIWFFANYGVAVTPDFDVTEICLAVNAESCTTSNYWARFSPRSADNYEIKASPNGSGPAIVPLAYSLMSAGLIMGLGTYLFKDERQLPWIQVVAGLVVGVAAYGLSEAFDGHSNFDNQ
jgi:hypothetical protein